MVAHNLAKVRVASSNLVIRSSVVLPDCAKQVWETTHGGLAERRGSGLQSRPHRFESGIHLNSDSQELLARKGDWRSGSALP